MTRPVSRLFQSLIKYPCGRIGLRKQNLIAMSKLAAKKNLISSRDCHSCFIFSIILVALKNPQREHSSFHLSDPKIQTGNLSFKTHPLNSLFYIDPKTGTKASSWRCFGPERVDKAKSRGEQRRYGKRYERRRRISTKQQQRKNSNCCGR